MVAAAMAGARASETSSSSVSGLTRRTCKLAPPTVLYAPALPPPQAAAFAELLCRAGPWSAAQLIACQGVPFLRLVVVAGHSLLVG